MDSQPEFVVDVMTRNPVVVGPDMTAWSADCLARKRNVHYLLVVDGYRLVGVVCGCDLTRAKADSHLDSCMRTEPVTVDDQETAAGAATKMLERHVGCLPVLDWSGSLRGVVTRHDLRAAGVLSRLSFRTCSSCGSTHGLPPETNAEGPPEEGAIFCVRCQDRGNSPKSDIDESYITLGGGD
ncbi:MAG TPA: CBS domain-containing protein [Polyangiaceae bacterium]|nr:CBS domain-containing protein [Polyangiaceae bacterium]